MFNRWIVALLGIVCCVHGTEEAVREKILNLLSGEWVSRGLYVVTKLEVADHLQSGSKSIEELGILTSSNPDSLNRLLHMLAGFGVFEEVSFGVYANTDASSLLIQNNPDTLYGLSLFYGEEIHKSWDELLASVQTGTPAFELMFKTPVFSYLKKNPAQALQFQEAMKEKSKAVIQGTLSNYDFSSFRSVYDIGGGHGQFLQAILQKYPHLHGVLFDLPEVIEKNTTMRSNRCRLISGDFFDSIPSGGDVYLLKSILHDWDDQNAERILKNCRQVMGPKSRLLMIEVVLQPKDQSTYANCMDVLMLAITGGKERSLESFNQMIENCGFVLEHIYPTSTEFSILEIKTRP